MDNGQKLCLYLGHRRVFLTESQILNCSNECWIDKCNNQRVSRQHEVFTGQWLNLHRVVAQAKAFRPRQPGEVAGDEIGL
jgi:hypothetical protein